MTRRIATALSALALGALTALALAPAAPAQGQGPEGEPQSPTEEEIGLLFVQAAKRGTLQKVKGRPVFKLKLHDLNRQVVWFQDRPGRHSGHLSIGAFVRAWAGFGFAESRPNAALTLLDGHRDADTAVFKLSKPRYRPKQRTLRYFARQLSEAEGNLSHFEHRRDRRLPRRFRSASLFIDDATGQVTPSGCVIQPYTQCSRSNLDDVDLTGADLTGADLSFATLGYTNLTNANLTNADLWKATLVNTKLTNANLTGADLRWTFLFRVDFLGADLTGANLNFATFCETRMPEGWMNSSSCPW
jgi:hypothetical protein